MSKLNLILIITFVIIAVVATLMFSGILPGFKGGGSGGGKGVPITLWGAYDSRTLQPIIKTTNDKNKGVFVIQYVQKSSSDYESELVNAMASGAGPDLFFLPQDLILKHQDKLFLIPYQYFSERLFRDSFIEQAELFSIAGDENGEGGGILAMPFSIDPIVAYWNRDLFNSAGIPSAPKFWDSFLLNVQTLTSYDNEGNIAQSGAALGESFNISNYKEILSLLILQTGNKIVDPKMRSVVFNDAGDLPLNPAENALRFYTQFSNPAKSSYSWNRGLGQARDFFAGRKMAIYFGFASEYGKIMEQNPHLNFDAAPIPQINGGSITATFGMMNGIAVSKQTKNIGTAISAAFALSGKEAIEVFSEAMFLPPVRRDIIGEGANDPIMSVFYQAAISSRGWLEPDPDKVSEIFKSMINDASTGRLRISEAVEQAGRRLEQLLK